MTELTSVEKRLAEILKVDLNSKNLKTVIFKRLEYLGYTEKCSRCGGTGHYSFNLMYGTTCFKCAGAKSHIPSKLSKTAEKLIIADMEAGKLEPYFESIKILQLANKSLDMVHKAWQNTGITNKYDWAKATLKTETGEYKFPEDRRIADINSIMYDEYMRIQKLSDQYKKFGPEYSKDKEDFANMLKTETEKAVNIINEAVKQI